MSRTRLWSRRGGRDRLAGPRGAALIAGAVIASIGLAACGSSTPSSKPKEVDSEIWSAPAKGDLELLKWNLPFGEPDSLDAVQLASFSNAMVLSNLCDALMREAPDGTVTPALASSVEQVSPTVVKITVAGDRTFWDGQPVTAEDVQFSLNRLIADPRSLYSGTFGNVESFTTTGANTVEMRLKKPDTLLITQLRNSPTVIFEKKAVQAAGDSFGTPQGGVMCSGPFKLASWQAGQKIVLDRNDDYWDADLKPRAKQVELSFVTDANTLTLALKSGQIDGTYSVPISGLDLLDAASDAGKVYFGPSPNQFVMIMNTTEGKWADPRVREALALAVPYREISAALYQGAAEPARTAVPPGGWSAEGAAEFQKAWEDAPEPAQDLDKAKALMKEAGAEGLRLNLGGVSDQAEWKNVLNAIADGAKQAGFAVTVVAKPNAVYQPMLYDPDAIADIDVLTNEWNVDYHEPRVLFRSMGLGRWSGITADDAEYGAAYDRAVAAASADERTEASLAVQARAHELRDWMPVAYLYNRLWLNKKVTGAPVAWGWWCYPFLAKIGAA